jgi:hypothetical protein
MKNKMAFIWMIISIVCLTSAIISIFIISVPRYYIAIGLGGAVFSFLTMGAILED